MEITKAHDNVHIPREHTGGQILAKTGSNEH